MFPDSGVDLIVVSNDIRKDTTKLVDALMVSAKFREIIPFSKDETEMKVECKHIHSGIAIHIEVMTECNSSFSGFIKYAKHINGFIDLYLCFQYYLRNNNIDNDSNIKMIIYFLVIYYIQVPLGYTLLLVIFTHRGHADNLTTGDLFIGLLDTVSKSSLLMPSLSKSRHPNYSFISYLKSVQPKLGIHIDLTSKNTMRLLKVRMCELCYSDICYWITWI